MDWIIVIILVLIALFCLANFVLLIFRKKRRKARLVKTVVSAAVLMVLIGYGYSIVSKLDAVYPADKILLGNEKIMVIVPHPDDELLLAAGVMALARNNGAEVKIILATNGNSRGIGYGLFRLGESLKAAQALGLSRDDVIFMGYSNGMLPTLYNSPAGDTLPTDYGKSGQRETLGLANHDAYHNQKHGTPAALTRDNFLQDLQDIILEYRPTRLIVIDRDSHPEHAALGYLTDMALAKILSDPDNTYKPRVYKGFAYNTGLKDSPDLYNNITLLPTFKPDPQKLQDQDYELDNPYYTWNERLRYPMPRAMLYPDMLRNQAAKAVLAYLSQAPLEYLPGYINSDKTYWERHTTGLLYAEDLSASSGNAGVLNDFMLGDGSERYFWQPMTDDPEQTVTVSFPEPQSVSAVWLYQNPAPASKITGATLSFDNGYSLKLGQSDLRDTVVKLYFAPQATTGFTFTVHEAQPGWGLAELEAYSAVPKPAPDFIKITDRSTDPDNFVYALFMNPKRNPSALLGLYAPGGFSDDADPQFTIAPADGSVAINEGKLEVGPNAKGRYNITVNSGDLSDTVGLLIVSNWDLTVYKSWQMLTRLSYPYLKIKNSLVKKYAKLQ